MSIKDIEDEISDAEGQRKLIYWVGLSALVAVAIFVPERYAILCFLGAVLTALFEISRKLLNIYYSNRAKLDTIISVLLTISRQLQEKERAIK
jgi:hypothetical protein